MAKIYATDGKVINEAPQIQIGDRLFGVDTRKSTYDRMQKTIESNNGEKSDEDIILEHAFGAEAYKQILKMDLPISGFLNLITYVYAAMFDLSFEDAEARFRRADKQ
jgi:hypothetical protein